MMVNDHQTKAKDDIMNQASVRLHETESFLSGIALYNESRKEADGKIALEYQEEEKLLQETACVEAEEKALAKSNGQVARSTLALERPRLKKLEQFEDMNQFIKSRSNNDFSLSERHLARMIKQISGTKKNATAKTNQIIKIFNDPRCPVYISIAVFAKKMLVSSCPNPFALSSVIVHATSQFPLAMDILLAEFHKACSYTVPRVNSESAPDSDDALGRLDYIMRLYGALVQTEIPGATNSHGIEHGLTWLARFFKNIPGNDRASATALNAFLQTAGYGLHQRYKSHFLKVVNVVRDYLATLRAKKDSSDLQVVITKITMYLDKQMYLKVELCRHIFCPRR